MLLARIDTCSVLVLFASSLLSTPADAAYRFDNPGDYLTAASELPAWATALKRHEAERIAIDRCLDDDAACEGRLESLRLVLIKGTALESDDQLRLVNRYINRRRYRRDRRQAAPSASADGEARLPNHWSTLLEFLRRGGDCEDFASAKYFLLREFGVPAEDMRVVVVYDRRVREHHAVLAVRRSDDSVWLLENDNTIKRRSHAGYRFIYAVNEHGIWDHAD